MLDHEPQYSNYDELKKAQEAAQEQSSNQPGNQPHREDYNELKAEHTALKREPEDELKSASAPEHVNVIDDTESKMTSYRRELQIEFEAGRIDRHEQIRREKLYDQQLTSAIKSVPEGKTVALPEPEPARTSQALGGQLVSGVTDWERMLTDRDYRRQREEELKQDRALRLQEMQQERGNGQQRSGSGGRER